MADFSITTADGSVYHVTADSQEMAMSALQRMLQATHQGQAPAAPPTERLRAAEQGLTFGFGDEINAGARAIASKLGMGDGKGFDATLADERSRLKQYKADYPGSSLGYEMAGAAVPVAVSWLAAPFTGGVSAEVTAPEAGNLARIAGTAIKGAIKGGIGGGFYGLGTGEGRLDTLGSGEGDNRWQNAFADAAGGAALGGGLGGVGQGLKTYVAGTLINWLRKSAGDKMAGIVAQEVQRMAANGGMTADEVIEGVRNGTLMAENRTLTGMVRKFYTEGGPAAAEIGTTLGARPGATRKIAVDEIQKYLSEPGNPLANRAATDEAAKLAENAAYDGVWAGAPKADGSVVDMLKVVASDAPEALAKAATAARLKYGIKPFFTTAPDGTIQFTREPSLQEAEIVRRALNDLSSSAYKASDGAIGEGYGTMEKLMRGQLDRSSVPLATARADAAAVRESREAFVIGQQAATMSPDQLAILIPKIEAQGTEQLKAFREGLMVTIRARTASPSTAPGVMRDLANADTGKGTALHLALPQGAMDSVAPAVDRAVTSAEAAKAVLGGSQTAQSLNTAGIGDPMNMARAAIGALHGDAGSISRLIGSIIQQAAPSLSPGQRVQIARIILSEDPKIVERALKDNGLVGVLQHRVGQAINQVVGRAASAAGRPVMGRVMEPSSGAQ